MRRLIFPVLAALFALSGAAEAKDPEATVLTLPTGQGARISLLAEDLAKALGVKVIAAHQLKDTVVTAASAPASYSLAETRALLRSHGAFLIWEKSGAGWVLHILGSRELAQFRPQNVPVIKNGGELPAREMVVNAIYDVTHADARELFNVMRALIQRYQASTPIGEIYFDPSAKRFIFHGLTSQLRSMLSLVRELDQPAFEASARVVAIDIGPQEEKILAAAGPLVGERCRVARDHLTKTRRAQVVTDLRLAVRALPEVEAAGLKLRVEKQGRTWTLQTDHSSGRFHLEPGQVLSLRRPGSAKDNRPERIYFLEFIGPKSPK